jgi:hypothetical protein
MRRLLIILFLLISAFCSAQEDVCTQTKAWYKNCSATPDLRTYTSLNFAFFCPEINNGNFALFDRVWMFGVGLQIDTYTSLVNPTSTALTAVNTPTWIQWVGYTGGSPTYLNSNFNGKTEGVNYTLNSSSLGVYRTTSSYGSALQYTDMGSYDGNLAFLSISTNTDIGQVGSCNVSNSYSNYDVATSNYSTGLWEDGRTGSASSALYLNGTSVTSTTIASNAIPNEPFFIMALYDGGSPLYESGNTYCMAYMGSGSINHSKLSTDINKLSIILGW